MRLFDCHAHTSDLSYCCDPGITPQTYLDVLAARPDALLGIAITNHGFAAYTPSREIAFAAEFMKNPAVFDRYLEFGNARLETHLTAVAPLRERGLYTGMEVEMLPDGRLTMAPAFRDRLDVLIGSVHFLPELDPAAMAPDVLLEGWWRHTRQLVQTGIDILGHPFRWLSKVGRLPVTPDLIDTLVELVRQHGVAVEINSHFIIPADLELIRACRKAGVPLAFGSDSHSRDEIGKLDYQVNLIRTSKIPLKKLPVWLPKRLRAAG